MTTDDQTTPIVESWLAETSVTPPPADQSVDKVIRHLPRTRQLGRWWWLPSFTRTQVSTPPAIPDTEYQPAPIPATNGHTPSVTGRTQSMFSPVKAIIAGAIVFALGGVLLIAQPFDQQGSSVPGAATDAQPEAPVAVTGSVQPGPCAEGPAEPGSQVVRVVGGVMQERGGYCNPHWAMSDSRLSGTATWMTSNDAYLDGSDASVGYASLSIENEDGVWREVPQIEISFPGASEADTWVTVFEGEGAYEGLVAVFEATEGNPGLEYAGFIIDGGLPPFPENASTE